MMIVPRLALAETEIERADRLFRDGRAALNEGRYETACADFAESQRLDPAAGTMVNLAVCLEAEGKTVSAWSSYHAALALNGNPGDPQRERFARERIAALERLLSALTLLRPPNIPVGLVVKLDGTTLSGKLWQTPTALDPGTHLVEVAAPGCKPWSAPVTLDKGSSLVLAVPALLPEIRPTSVQPATTPSSETAKPPNTLRWAFAAGGVSIAGLAATAYFGLRASAEWNQRQAHCPAQRCDAEAVRASASASRFAVAADIAAVISATAAGASLAIALAQPRRSQQPRAELRVRPSSASIDIVLGGAF